MIFRTSLRHLSRLLLFATLLSASAGPSTPVVGWRVVPFAGAGTDLRGRTVDTLRIRAPFGVALDRRQNAFVVDMSGHRVFRFDADGSVRVLAGTGAPGEGSDGGMGEAVSVNGPHCLALARNGDLFFADTWNNRVCRVHHRTGKVDTVAGTGKRGYSGDGGAAVAAEFGGIYGMSLEPEGRVLYLADLDNRRIRAVDLRTGKVRTIAGNGMKGVPSDGSLAVESPLVDPRAVAADGRGNLYIAERSGNAVRRVDRSGRIHTVVGVSGTAGDFGDGGDGRAARLRGPKELAIDLDGALLIADTENHSIRRYDTRTGRITRVVGTGVRGSGPVNSPALDCALNQPHGVWVHPKGDLFISDSSNGRVLRIRR